MDEFTLIFMPGQVEIPVCTGVKIKREERPLIHKMIPTHIIEEKEEEETF